MSKVSIALAFSLGAAVGSVVTWKLLKDKYEQLAREEIQEAYSRKSRLKEVLGDVDETHGVENAEYKRVVRDYSTSSVAPPENREEDETMNRTCRVISPEDFGDMDDYELKSLTYYHDGVLTDDSDEPIDDVEGLIGIDPAEHFGEFEDDSVFVRDDEEKIDYEILRDLRNYTDVHPHQVEE